jgi:hypothetical protein
MNESETRLSFSSSFLRRRHIELASYLINEMGFDPVVAKTLLHIHKPSSLTDVLRALLR